MCRTAARQGQKRQGVRAGRNLRLSPLAAPVLIHPNAPLMRPAPCRWALRPLEQRFGLALVQGAVLSASNTLAAALINTPDLLACGCSPRDVADLGPVAPAAAAARRRRQLQRELTAAAAARAAGDGGGGSGDGGVADVAAAGVTGGVGYGGVGLPVEVGGVGRGGLGLAEGAGGGGEVGAAGAGYVRWATQGVEAMVGTAEALLRLEGRGWGQGEVQGSWGQGQWGEGQG